MNIDANRIGYLMNIVHRAAMKALDRHAPTDPPIVPALVMEQYEEFLGEHGDFRKQMIEKYGIEYPLNFRVKEQSK